jgi:uncharacterized protein with PIN domain
VKFVADGMLGSLSRWLRMMGHNVEYSTSFNDDKLLGLAKEEGRVLLTRDLELYKWSTTRGIDAFYVEGKYEADRLAAIAGRFGIGLEVDLRTSRCPLCNTTIQIAPKTCVADRVEKNTFAHYDEFWECPKCGKVYWQGAHWPKILATLEEAKTRLKNNAGV